MLTRMLKAVITVSDQPAEYLTCELCVHGVKMQKWYTNTSKNVSLNVSITFCCFVGYGSTYP